VNALVFTPGVALVVCHSDRIVGLRPLTYARSTGYIDHKLGSYRPPCEANEMGSP
jgi:hypothetical protein